jgi:fluoroacetyl-CoA thioesterase
MQEGLEATVEVAVGEADTARSIGSGDVDVLATPRIVALCEEAAVAAIASSLDAGQTSVGTRVVLDHVAPTVVGRSARATARLEHVDGKTLSFAIEVSDDAGVVARGTHTRVVVDRERFVRNANDRR